MPYPQLIPFALPSSVLTMALTARRKFIMSMKSALFFREISTCPQAAIARAFGGRGLRVLL